MTSSDDINDLTTMTDLVSHEQNKISTDRIDNDDDQRISCAATMAIGTTEAYQSIYQKCNGESEVDKQIETVPTLACHSPEVLDSGDGVVLLSYSDEGNAVPDRALTDYEVNSCLSDLSYEDIDKIDACKEISLDEKEVIANAALFADLNAYNSSTLESCDGLALTVDGVAHIVPKIFVEQVGEDVIDINGVKIAVACPLCLSIKCSGPNKHDYELSLDQALLGCLPSEIILKILQNLSAQDLCQYVAPVCKGWRWLAYDASLWTSLDLSACSDISTPWLTYLLKKAGSNLKCLKFRGRNLNLIDVHMWSRSVPELIDLDLAFCSNLNAPILQTLYTNCPRLNTLNLEGVKKISMEEMEIICQWHLVNISLCYCERTESSVLAHMVENNSDMRSININGIADTEDSVIEKLAIKYQNSLEYLDLDGEEMGDDGFKYLSLCSKLRRLTVHYSHAITDKSLPFILNLNRLKHLKIRDGKLLTSDGISRLFRGVELRGVRELDLSECSAIEDRNVLEVVRCCGPHLTSLNLSWTYLITDVSLHYIIDHCPNLERLLMVGNKRLQGENLLDIATQIPRLVLLDLEMCDGIDDDTLIDLILEKPELKITNYYGEILQHS